MKKFMIIAASAAVVLSACAKIDMSTSKVNDIDEPVAFGAYARKAVVKAGQAGELTTTALQGSGFGVFAYQTTGDYTASATPNFMYNTKVYGASWTYDIIKYWPNQIQAGNTDSQPATAFRADKVSFFAYGPYVKVTASTGDLTGDDTDATSGITALTNNAATGDPKVSFKVSNDLSKQVDLVWAVSNGATWTNVGGTNNTPVSGKPYLNLQKPALNTAIHFYFKHALSQVKLQAVAAYNQAAAGGDAQDGVKITIESVTVTIPGVSQTADLNLNNTTADAPLWENASGSSDLALNISGVNINAALRDAGDILAKDQPAGVTGTATDVIADSKYYTIIPKEGATDVNVKIVYYVTTDDPDLLGGKSRVKNQIEKTVSFAKFEAGKKNTIKMILGISEVKFEAEVAEWADGLSGEVNLPLNS